MDLSRQWVRQSCQPDSKLLLLEHAALVHSYAALLAAGHAATRVLTGPRTGLT
jgi:cell division inhibitor SulA